MEIEERALVLDIKNTKTKIPVAQFLFALCIGIIIGSIAIYAFYAFIPSFQKTTSPAIVVNHVTILPEYFSGKLTRLSINLHLESADSSAAQSTKGAVYYSAGTYIKGAFVGYTRIIMIPAPTATGIQTSYTLASKDMKTFVLDADPADHTIIKQFDPTKVVSATTLDSDAPQTIALSSPFLLYKKSLGLTTIQKANDIETVLETKSSASISLTKKVSTLSFFAMPITGNMQPYLASSSDIYSQDETGLVYVYALTTKQDYASYMAMQSTTAPINFTAYPGVSINTVGLKSVIPLYQSYADGLTPMCATNGTTMIAKNITLSDLIKVGSSQNISFYVLKNIHNELNDIVYQNKIASVSVSDFSLLNNISPPAKDAYLQNHPLVFIQDPFNRWIVIAENIYKEKDGCF